MLQAAHLTCLPLFGLTACLELSWIHTPGAKNYHHTHIHSIHPALCLTDYKRMCVHRAGAISMSRVLVFFGNLPLLCLASGDAPPGYRVNRMTLI